MIELLSYGVFLSTLIFETNVAPESLGLEDVISFWKASKQLQAGYRLTSFDPLIPFSPTSPGPQLYSTLRVVWHVAGKGSNYIRTGRSDLIGALCRSRWTQILRHPNQENLCRDHVYITSVWFQPN